MKFVLNHGDRKVFCSVPIFLLAELRAHDSVGHVTVDMSLGESYPNIGTERFEAPYPTRTTESLLEAAKCLARGILEECGLEPLEVAEKDWFKLREDSKKLDQKTKDDTSKKDATMKRRGFTHRVDAWIHPVQGGDDYMIQSYTEGPPTSNQIAYFLRASSVKTDYQVTVI